MRVPKKGSEPFSGAVCIPWTAVILAFVGCSAAQTAWAAPKAPNVIVILSDDQGYGDFSCHGNPVLKTPNLDRLHSQSVRLTDFHVAPMCTPTRGQLMTGLDALHSGASSVCAGRSFVRRGIPIMSEVFAGSGYRTAMFGKWHLGDSYPHLPHQRGFEAAVYHLGWGITSMADLWQNDYFDGRFRDRGTLKQFKGYCTDIWFGLASDWLRQQRAAGQPFFLYLPTNAPHGPAWVADEYKKPYEKGKGVPAAFFGMIANLDENIGKFDALLRELGLVENTITVFMNDNGGTGGVKLYNAGMRGRKTEYYDGGHRAACFIRWPAGGLKPRNVDTLAQIQDLLLTFIDLCGLKRPVGATFDGASLAGLLRGTVDRIADRILVVQYGQVPNKGDCAVMWNKWRLVHGTELYNLADDPGQQRDVSAKQPEVLAKLRGHYDKWWAAVEPKLDDFSPVSIGAEQENPVCLTAADWANVYCDNMHDCRGGAAKNGPWHVLVEKAGTYEFSLRRWPKEADAPIAAAVPEFKAVAGRLEPGRALPIAKARLKIGSFDQSLPVAPGQKFVRFSVPLQAGPKVELQTWFYDAQGQELCGAYFVDVERK